MQLIFINEGETFIHFYIFEITTTGLINSISAASRFISIILLSYLFVLSTDPGKFVSSLVGIGLPYRFGYTLITALRMIPLVKAEVEKILFAQVARGANFKAVPIKKAVENIGRFLKVVLIAMFKRVNQLVISMEGRSFGLYDTRSTLSKIHYLWTDYVIISLSLALILISILWR
jgi:energy-coupling factor transport system permease protein